MASKSDLEMLVVLSGRVDPSLVKSIASAITGVDNLNKKSSLVGNVAKSSFNALKSAVTAGASSAINALGKFALNGLDLASDLEEVQKVIDATFGDGAKQIDIWSKTAIKGYGISELSVKQFAGSFGVLMKSAGVSGKNLVTMSENVAALSGDFASFYNLKPEEAFEKIKAGISGEIGPLNALGINMSEANLEHYAMSKGIKTAYGKMDEANKTILRYNYLLDKSKVAQGDFARNQDSCANQQRLFKESFKQLSGTIMSAALPAFTSLFKKGNELISTFLNSPEKVARVQQAIQGVGEKIIAYIPVAVDMLQKFGAFISDVAMKAADLYHFISDNWSFIAPIIIGIVGAMALWKIGSGIKAGIDGITLAYNALKAVKVKDRLETLYLQALYLKDAILKGTSTVATWAMTAATVAWNIAAGIGAVVTTAFGVAVAFLTSPIGLVILAIVALIGIVILLWKNWDKVSAWIVGLWKNNILPFFQAIGGWFSGLWTGMVNGLKNAWSSVTAWFTNLWNNGILPLFQTVVGWFSGIWTGMVSGFQAAWSSILPWIQVIGGWFSGLWTGIVGGFQSAWSGVQTTFQNVITLFKGFLNMCIQPFNSLIAGINSMSFTVPNWVPFIGGKGFSLNIPLIPTFANGGFANQPSIFGEAGPEAAIPLKRTPRSLSLLNQTARVIGADGAGSKPTFVFSPVISGVDTGKALPALKSAADDFFTQADAWWESKRRESFA
ncbi:hypothetical protein [Gorillibacterium massiliense]|uniref:hypothetical protein n=1 Tax=Gorillibacterium massiliense TaxID=1280390 RepID=UPI0004B132FA|nr:hypothetical protein [Gorillibacterium massiliense]